MRLTRIAAVALLMIVLISTVACSRNKIATAENMFVSSNPYTNQYSISVELKPGDLAQADTVYTVDLYEGDAWRATGTVSWSQSEIDIKDNKYVEFPASEYEHASYFGADISHIFSVKIHE